jgi:hypothetical protein
MLIVLGKAARQGTRFGSDSGKENGGKEDWGKEYSFPPFSFHHSGFYGISNLKSEI